MSIRVLTLVIAFLTASDARANFIGNDTSNFNPVPGGIDFVTVHSSETLASGIFNSGFFLNYAGNSLPPTIEMSGQVIGSSNSVLFSDINLAYGISERLELGTSFSFLLNQAVDRTASGAQFSGTGLNEIRLLGKYSVLKRAPIGAALIASANINQSENNPFAGQESAATLNLEGSLDRKFGAAVVALNLGYRFRQKGRAIVGAVYEPLGNQAIASLAASYYLPSFDTKLIAELYMAKPTESVRYIESSGISSELLLGLKYDALANASINVGGGTRLSKGFFTPDWRAYLGVNINFDVLETPTTTMLPQPAIVNVSHYKGYLPRDIEVLKEYSFDEISKSHEFQLRTTVPEKDFAGVKPPFEVIRLESFDFDFGSSQIRPNYYALLDRLAAYLAAEPSVIKIRVEGHTDSIGSLERNRTVSQARADSLKQYLNETAKLDRLKIEAVGFGADRPIADNGNFQGRKQNRRVEIRILRRLAEGPTRLE